MNNVNAIRAAIANLQIKKNDGVSLVASITDPNNNDLPLDLSLFSIIRMQVKRSVNDADSLVELSLGSGLTVEGLGVLRIVLSPTDTGLAASKYVYDVQGDDITILEGDFIIVGDVTT